MNLFPVFLLFLSFLRFLKSSDVESVNNEQPKTFIKSTTFYDMECPICIEPLSLQPTETFLTRCGHFQHTNCLRNWLNNSIIHLCPVCRKNCYMNSDQELNIYIQSNSLNQWLRKEDVLHLINVLIHASLKNVFHGIKDITKALKKYEIDWRIMEVFKQGLILLYLALQNENIEIASKKIIKAILKDESDGFYKKILGRNSNVPELLKFVKENETGLVSASDIGDVSLMGLIRKRAKIVLETLIPYGINVNYVDKNTDDLNALQMAATDDSIEIFSLLIKSDDVDLTVRDDFNKSLLHRSIETDNIKIVELLLNLHSADHKKQINSIINYVDSEGKGLVRLIGEKNRLELLVKLFQRGLKIDSKSITWILEEKLLNLMKFIINNDCFDLNQVVNKERMLTIIQITALAGSLEMFKLLLDTNRINIKVVDQSHQTLLHILIADGKYDFAKYLLNLKNEFYASQLSEMINRTDSQGRTAVFLAFKKKHIELFKLLLDNKADIYKEIGENSIFQLVQADMNDNDIFCKFSLLLTAYKGTFKVTVRSLAQRYGEQMNTKQFIVTTMQQMSIDWSDSEILELGFELIKCSLDYNHHDIVSSLFRNDNEVVDFLKTNLGQTPNIAALMNIEDYFPEAKNDKSFIHFLFERRVLIVAIILARHDVNFNLIDEKSKKTALQMAACDKHLEIFKLIINKKIFNSRCVDNSGNPITVNDILITTEKFDIDPESVNWALVKFTNIQLFTMFLNTGCADLLQRDDRGRSILHDKIDSDCMEILLKTEIATYKTQIKEIINTLDDNGKSPLYYAIEKNRIEVTKLLYGYGAITTVNCVKLALERNLDKIITVMVNYNANFNYFDKEIGMTLIQIAAIRRYLPSFMAILAGNNIDLKSLDNYGNSILHLSIDTDQFQIASHLLKLNTRFYSNQIKTIINYLDSNGKSALLLALEYENLGIVDALIKAGAEIDANSIRYIFVKEYYSILQSIFKQNIFTNQITDQNRHLLLLYIVNLRNIKVDDNWFDFFTFAMKNSRVNLFLRDEKGKTLLHGAIFSRNFKIAEYILKNTDPFYEMQKRFIINSLDNEGSSPMQLAFDQNEQVIIDLLVVVGARVDIGTVKLLLKKNRIEDLKALIIKSERFYLFDEEVQTETLPLIAYDPYIDLFEMFLKLGDYDLNKGDENGRTILHVSIETENFMIALCLLKLTRIREIVNQTDDQNRSPLLLAVMNSNLMIVKKLIKHGALIDFKSILYTLKARKIEILEYFIRKGANFNMTDPESLFILAQILAKDKFLESFKLLLDSARIDLSPIDGCGRTLLHTVIESGQFEIAEYLIKLSSRFYKKQIKTMLNHMDYRELRPLQLANMKDNAKLIELISNIKL